MSYEELCTFYEHLPIQEMNLREVSGLKGLYYDGCIAIEKTLTETEKACILAEELGHHYTTQGNILNQSVVANKKQEYKARLWAYDKQVGLLGIIKAFKAGCANIYEMSEHLSVPEDFLRDALTCYNNKYGDYIEVDNYIIYFSPYLGVFELL